MFKTMKKSRLAMIVCVLVLAMVMTTMLALGVFADDATDKIDSYNVSIGDGLNIVVNGTTATASSKLTIKYQFEGCEQMSIETTSSASNAYSVSIPVGPGQIDKTCTITMYVEDKTTDESETVSVGEPKTISVMDYCVSMINDYLEVEDIEGVEVSAELAQVCIDILLFGQESLKYLNLDTTVIDAKLEEIGIDASMATPYETPKVYMENGAEMTEVPEGGTKITKVSLKVTDRYHLVFKDADGNEIVTQTVNIPSISKPYTVVGTKLVDEENNTYEDYTNTVTYSVTTYIVGMADDPNAGALVKQLYSLALAIDAYQGHQFKTVTPSSCSTNGQQVCDLCGQEVNAPLDPNNHKITSTVKYDVLHNACELCDYEWISVANYWINDGTSTNKLGANGTTKFDTAQTTGLPALKDGKLAWVRSEDAKTDQYQTWIETGVLFSEKPESWSAFFSIDLTSASATLPDGMDTVNKLDREIGFAFRLLVSKDVLIQGKDRWANAVAGNLLNITADGTMTGFSGLSLGTFDGSMTFAVQMTSDKDGLYVTYYVDNECKGTVKCAHPVEGYYAYGQIYQTGYTSQPGTGMCMDNIIFASTNSNKAITDVDFATCGSIAYKLGGVPVEVDKHNWQDNVSKEPTCTATGLASSVCSICQAQKDGREIPVKAHTITRTTTATSVSYHCETCDTMDWTSSTAWYGDGSSANGFAGDNKNKSYTDGTTTTILCPNGYYQYVRIDTTEKQVNTYIGDSTYTGQDKHVDSAFFSVKLMGSSVGFNSGWSMKLSNTDGVWPGTTADKGGKYENGVLINLKGIDVILGASDGKTLTTANKAPLATLATDAWTAIDIAIVFDHANDKLVLTYYVDGAVVATESIANNLNNDMFNKIYFTGSDSSTSIDSEKGGASIFFDDVIIAKHKHTPAYTIKTDLSEVDHTATHTAPSGTLTYACTCGHSFTIDAIAAITFDNCLCGFTYDVGTVIKTEVAEGKTPVKVTKDGALSIIGAVNPDTASNNIDMRLTGSAAPVYQKLEDAQFVTVGFTVTMPEAGFPEAGVSLNLKYNNVWANSTLTVKNNQIEYNGKVVATVTANVPVSIVATADARTEGKIIWNVWIDGSWLGQKEAACATDAEGKNGATATNTFDTNPSGNYMQLTIPGNGTTNTDPNRGIILDNVFWANELPTGLSAQ